ncbi:hypothetical protein EDB19DRAFT_1834975 [Suillus lakei]|nr:hypothetical protein EDB19DRAFT_1834975 [Suillus lakei]
MEDRLVIMDGTSVKTVDMITPAAKRVKTEPTMAPISVTPAQPQPPGVQLDTPAKSGDQCWAKKFLPTILLWMGSLEEDHVWTIADAKLLEHIQVVFDVVYPELSIQVVQNGVIFSLHSNFGSTAITIIIDFLTSDKECDPQAHLAAISGHTNIPALKTHVLASSGMLERAVEMIATGDIKAENILASASSSKTNIKLPKILNKVTGKETSGSFLFSHDRCAKKTKQYTTSIKKKGPTFIASLTDIACSALKENAAWGSTVSEDESKDECALLLPPPTL